MPARVRSLAVLLLATAACARGVPARDLATTLAGVPSAEALHGIRLGMSVRDLRRERPHLRAVNGRMLDSASGYVLSYQVERRTPDSALIGVWAMREFATRDAMATAWSASLRMTGQDLGAPVACYEAPVAAGSTEGPEVQAALWETGPLHLSAMTSTRSHTTAAMFYDGQRRPHDRLNVIELTIARRPVWDQVTSAVALLAPGTRHSCGTAGASQTMAAR